VLTKNNLYADIHKYIKALLGFIVINCDWCSQDDKTDIKLNTQLYMNKLKQANACSHLHSWVCSTPASRFRGPCPVTSNPIWDLWGFSSVSTGRY
jgi:hypothetical protein